MEDKNLSYKEIVQEALDEVMYIMCEETPDSWTQFVIVVKDVVVWWQESNEGKQSSLSERRKKTYQTFIFEWYGFLG